MDEVKAFQKVSLTGHTPNHKFFAFATPYMGCSFNAEFKRHFSDPDCLCLSMPVGYLHQTSSDKAFLLFELIDLGIPTDKAHIVQ